ncbi:MAG: hypothetical protein AMDU3_IPLC00004G0440 [Thermoplasmatales archaeon I-plasma]|jgi:hypothetical protein|nr:MAG: hypothetical protein AMDU3_IPLC00004G0440 [Thermoplasmatales archaeon I-plasma]
MKIPRRFSGLEVKLPLTEWKEAVIGGVAGSTPVDVFLMFYNTWSIVILSVEDGKIVRREEQTEDYDDPRDEDTPYDPLDKMFRGVLNTGTIIDVGGYGTYLDDKVRYGVVCKEGVIWLENGTESDVMDVLRESMKTSMSTNKEEHKLPDSMNETLISANVIPIGTKRSMAIRQAVQLANLMLHIPDGMKRAIVRGMDSEGNPFYFYTLTMIDELYYRSWVYTVTESTSSPDPDSRENNGKARHTISVLYSDVVGFIRFPTEIVNSSQEGRLTPGNYNEIKDRLIREIIDNPEKWITDI